jgi:hypothetical protein
MRRLHEFHKETNEIHPILTKIIDSQMLIKSIIDGYKWSIAYDADEANIRYWNHEIRRVHPEVDPLKPSMVFNHSEELTYQVFLKAKKDVVERWLIAHLSQVLPTFSIPALKELTQRVDPSATHNVIKDHPSPFRFLLDWEFPDKVVMTMVLGMWAFTRKLERQFPLEITTAWWFEYVILLIGFLAGAYYFRARILGPHRYACYLIVRSPFFCKFNSLLLVNLSLIPYINAT